MNLQKAIRYLNKDYRKTQYGDQFRFNWAICHVLLGDFEKAGMMFEKNIMSMFAPPMLWEMTSQPNWLVDICVLSGRADLYPNVDRELARYQSDRRGESLIALYAYSVMEFLYPTGQNISARIEGLLKRPKIKDTYAMGLCIQSILAKNQKGLKDALSALLEVHKGQATRGGLRETAEGLLCMPAMSLVFVALERNMKVEIEDDYLSMGYLKYLQDHAKSRP